MKNELLYAQYSLKLLVEVQTYTDFGWYQYVRMQAAPHM